MVFVKMWRHVSRNESTRKLSFNKYMCVQLLKFLRPCFNNIIEYYTLYTIYIYINSRVCCIYFACLCYNSKTEGNIRTSGLRVSGESLCFSLTSITSYASNILNRPRRERFRKGLFIFLICFFYAREKLFRDKAQLTSHLF